MTVAVVVGNPRAGSRTLGVASAVAAALADDGEETVLVDLAGVAARLFGADDPDVAALVAAVTSADVVVVASPTYKGAYTGLLKAFLDLLAPDSLAGVVAVPVMTGAAAVHALAPEVHLRPVLVELGAVTPTRALFVTEDRLGELDEVVAAWAGVARRSVDRARRRPGGGTG